MADFRKLEIQGGTVSGDPESDSVVKLMIPAVQTGYTNAQIDDYGGRKRSDYLWHANNRVTLSLNARFSHPADKLVGTAGFGFWNAPFGDPTTPWPALPKATWFFLAGRPGDLPLNPSGPGQDFFASTLDATTGRALALAPLAPPVVLLNRIPKFKQTVWPRIQHRLGMSYQQIDEIDITQWHHYQLDWSPVESTFAIDGKTILQTDQSPRSPLGFVCWIDNQFMQVTPTGRMRAGALPLAEAQWLEIEKLNLKNQQS